MFDLWHSKFIIIYSETTFVIVKSESPEVAWLLVLILFIHYHIFAEFLDIPEVEQQITSNYEYWKTLDEKEKKTSPEPPTKKKS